jgi:arylsulfatase
LIRIPAGSAPDFKNKSWTVAAEVTIPQGGANGVLATIGGRYGGWALLKTVSRYSPTHFQTSRSTSIALLPISR